MRNKFEDNIVYFRPSTFGDIKVKITGGEELFFEDSEMKHEPNNHEEFLVIRTSDGWNYNINKSNYEWYAIKLKDRKEDSDE